MVAFAKPDNILAMPAPQGKSNEWYTPAKYIEAVREVMGGIDLDPASCELANQTVRATRYYSKEDDGLSKQWYGRVWLNPPYAKSDNKSGIVMWMDKFFQEYHAGNIIEATLLLPCSLTAKWLRLLWQYPICLVDHSLRFYLPYGGGRKDFPNWKTANHNHGTIFVYIGPNNERFAEVFSEFGPVIPANVAIRCQKVTPLSLWKLGYDPEGGRLL